MPIMMTQGSDGRLISVRQAARQLAVVSSHPSNDNTLRPILSCRTVPLIRRKIRLIEGNAKCRQLKELACIGTLR
jgi:hypothetical protein